MGALTKIGTSEAVSFMSEAVIAESVTNLTGIITGPIGCYTLIKSSDIGQSMGNLVVNMVNHFTDNLPEGHYLNPNQTITISNNVTAIAFEPPEVKMMSGLVNVNRSVNKISQKLTNDITKTIDKSSVTTNRYVDEVVNFNNETGEVSAKINNVHINNVITQSTLPYLTKIHAVQNINTDRLTQAPPPYIPSKIHDNSGHYTAVRCDDGEWSIKFCVNVGGGFSCVLL